MTAPDTPPPEPPLANDDEMLDTGDDRHPARFIHLLLDPRGLNALMSVGGGLLVLGLVLWLAVKGVFDEPINAALGLGAANLALLGGGVWLAAKTRYRLAGRGTTMLACLLLPLNLWFYDAQGVVTLNDGGHLWLPALVCCVIYAGVARLLKDSLFVYAFAAGVALTGLLFLADGGVARFWEVLAPSTLLVSLGVLAIHAERLFPTTTNSDAHCAFTRGDFGRAFFRAGHALLASGLGVLLAGRLAGRFYDSLFADLRWFEQPDVATLVNVKLAALGLALAGAYAYVYSQLTKKVGNRYLLFAAMSLAWSGLIGLDLLGVEFTEVVLVGLLAAVAVASRVAEALVTHGEGNSRDESVAEAFGGVARLAGGAALGLSLVQLTRGAWLPTAEPLGFEFTPGSVFASSLVAVAAMLGARGLGGEQGNRFVAAGLSLVVFVAGLVAVLFSLGAPLCGFATLPPGSQAVPMDAWLLIVSMVPAAGVAAAFRQESSGQRAALLNATEACLWTVGLLLAPHAAAMPTGLTIATTAVLATLFGFAARGGKRQHALVITALLMAANGWQAATVYGIGVQPLLLVLTAFGVAVLIAERFDLVVGMGGLGRAGVVLAATAGGLLAGNRLLAGETNWPLLGFLAGQTALTGVAACLTQEKDGRRALFVLGVVQTLVAGVVLNSLSMLTFLQRAELFCTAVGCGMVIAGVVGWRREAATGGHGNDSLTDVNLWVGSLLAMAPMTLSLLATRLFGGAASWIAIHEVGVLLVGMLLVGVGVLCRLRATTLVGAASLAVYLLSLVTLLRLPDQLQSVAVYLMAGGGLFFGLAVLLSVYRDRLLQLPEKIREGEGVFAVLKWR